MPEDFLTRLQRISSHILPGHTRARALGENYYTLDVTNEPDIAMTLPRIWIDPTASDVQIGEKIQRTFREMLHPETSADDSSVPGLKNEGKRRATGS
jgi:hypothetical protein